MRTACIAGFFNPVKKTLDKQFATELGNRSVVWIPQITNGELNINELKQAIFGAIANGATDILILAFIIRGKEYLRDVIQSLVQKAQDRAPNVNITVNAVLKNAQDGVAVASLIKAFEPREGQRNYPRDLAQLESWIVDNHATTVLLLPRARNNISKSLFEDVPLIYAAVDILGTEYHLMRVSEPDEAELNHTRCSDKILALGLELSPSISVSRAGEEGNEYYVYYPVGQLQKRKFLDHHLKKGSDRDERHCLRIYFFWDDELKKVVIGWLPSHLGTRMS